MPREIWNEGRVVGMSAYETYVKQHVIEDPTAPPATEREWLASSLAMGNSMILKVPTVSGGSDEHHYVDIPMPENTRLCAANTIIAQFFDGDIILDGEYWAKRVSDYGSLISNKIQSHPEGSIPGNAIHEGVPAQSLEDWDDKEKERLKSYMRIVDGIVLQPGTWSEWEPAAIPQCDFSADLSRPYPVIRLHIKGNIAYTARPLILLTGFTIRTVLSGISGTDSSLQTESPQDGDFLGPAVFPWANKIIFSVPNSYIAYFAGSGDYERLINAPTSEESVQRKTIKDTPVIDMQATKPEAFYEDYQTSEYYEKYSVAYVDPRNITYSVEKFTTLGDPPTDGEAVLTVYQKKDIYPPALYGTFVSRTHGHYLNPLDVVAPGTVKMFRRATLDDLKDYETTFPGTTAMNLSAGEINYVYSGTLYTLRSHPINFETVMMNTWNRYTQSEDSGFRASKFTLSGGVRPRLAAITDVDSGNTEYTLSMKQYQDVQVSHCPENGSADPSLPSWGFTPKYMLPTNEYDTAHVPNPAITLSSEWVESQHAGTDTTVQYTSFANLNWATLIAALTTNRSIDVLGYRLKSARFTLTRDHNSLSGDGTPNGNYLSPYLEFGPNPMVYKEGTGGAPGSWIDYSELRGDTSSNFNYANHIMRFYVTNNCPKTQWTSHNVNLSQDRNCVPIGSIGIGWGFSSGASIPVFVCREFVKGGTNERCWASIANPSVPIYNSNGVKISESVQSQYSPATYDRR